jgi:hypothetical protein
VLLTAGDTQRDDHIECIAQQGRLAWQRITAYNPHNYAGLAMQRYQRIFGNTMKARALPQQKTEAWVSVSALNRMTNFGMPVSVKVAKVANTGALCSNFLYSTTPVECINGGTGNIFQSVAVLHIPLLVGGLHR